MWMEKTATFFDVTVKPRKTSACPQRSDIHMQTSVTSSYLGLERAVSQDKF